MRRSHKVAKTDAVLGTETFLCEIRRCASPWLTTENTNEAHLPGAQRPTGSSRLFVSHGSSDRGRSRTSRAAGKRWSRTRRCARPSPGTQRGDIPGQVLDDAAAHYPDARVERHGAGLGSLQRPHLSGIGVHPTDLRHGGLSVHGGWVFLAGQSSQGIGSCFLRWDASWHPGRAKRRCGIYPTQWKNPSTDSGGCCVNPHSRGRQIFTA